MDQRNTHRPSYSIDGMVGGARSSHQRTGGRPVPRPVSNIRDVPQRRPSFHTQASMAVPVRHVPRTPVTTHRAFRAGSVQSHDTLPPIYSTDPQTQVAAPGKRRKHKRVGKHPKFKKIVLRTAAALAALVLISTGWLGWKVLHNTGKVFGSGSNLIGFLSAAPLKCEGSGRCNILLAGNSADDPGHDGANLTDSIMIVSVDLQHNNAFMLSVPRDLWVDIPGNGYAKINEAYPDGQSQHFNVPGYAKGGMGLLEETISQDFGIPISNYALIDYSALRQAVNAVGGIAINIQSDDPRGLYDPSIDYATRQPLVKLANGEHTLSGEQALDLARARGDAYGSYGFDQSDFTRTQDQRAMMLALKDKMMSSSVLANPIKLGQLFDAFGSNVHTDLTTGNIRRIYDISKQISSGNIKSYGLNSVALGGQKNVNLLANYRAKNGESALVPSAGLGDYSQIQAYLQQITSNVNNSLTQEAADVVVLNGSNTTGLAAAETKVLLGKGITVSATGNAPSPQNTNSIIDYSGGKDPATLAALKQTFGVSSTTANPTLKATYPKAAFVVILGESQQLPPTN